MPATRFTCALERRSRRRRRRRPRATPSRPTRKPAWVTTRQRGPRRPTRRRACTRRSQVHRLPPPHARYLWAHSRRSTRHGKARLLSASDRTTGKAVARGVPTREEAEAAHPALPCTRETSECHLMLGFRSNYEWQLQAVGTLGALSAVAALACGVWLARRDRDWVIPVARILLLGAIFAALIATAPARLRFHRYGGGSFVWDSGEGWGTFVRAMRHFPPGELPGVLSVA